MMEQKMEKKSLDDNVKATAEQPVVRCDQISFAYHKIPVLSGIDLKVGKSSLTVLLGANGAGKSTLMKLLLGELHPSQGCVELFGTCATKFKDWHRISYLPQNALERNQSFPANVFEIVRAHLYSVRKRDNLRGRDIDAKVYDALEMVGMRDYAKRQISRLSGGQQQRVMLAGVLAAGSDLLLLDEPTTGVDRQTVVELYELLRKLCHEHDLTILLITHDTSQAVMYADEVYCLEDGTLVELSPEQIAYEHEHKHKHPHL